MSEKAYWYNYLYFVMVVKKCAAVFFRYILHVARLPILLSSVLWFFPIAMFTL